MRLPDNTLLRGGALRIECFISQGGFSYTYEVIHLGLNKRFILKEFFIADLCQRDPSTNLVSTAEAKKELIDTLRDKFIEEARTQGSTQHEGLAQVTDVFSENGTAYYVMDFVDEADSLKSAPRKPITIHQNEDTTIQETHPGPEPQIYEPETPYDYQAVADRRNRKSRLIALITVAVLALLGVGGWLLFRNSYSETVELTPEFIENIRGYDQIDGFSDGLAAVRRGNKWGYIDTKGNEVIGCRYTTHPGKFSEGLACVETTEDGIHFIDKTGKAVITGEFFLTAFMGTAALHTPQSLMPYFIDGVCVLQDPDPDTDYQDIAINTKGERVPVPANFKGYDMLLEKEQLNENGYARFEETLAGVTKYGYKDSKGKIVIPAIYDELGEFHNGVALAALSFRSQFLKDNDPELPSDYFAIWGFVDEKGNSTFTEADFARLQHVMDASKEAEAQYVAEHSKKYYYVVVGSYQSLSEAQQFNNNGPFDSYYGNIYEATANGHVAYRVCTGCYTSKSKALRKAEELRESYANIGFDISPWIWPCSGKGKCIERTPELTVLGNFEDLN